MANLRVGTGITFDGATGNFNTLGIGTVRGAFNATSGLNVGTAATIHANGNVTCGIVTSSAFIPTSGQLSHRNLIINGAMMVAQRGTSYSGSSASTGYHTIDRFSVEEGGVDENGTKEQAAVTSGGAYDSGFRNCLKITNGNQTGGAGASDYVQIMQRIEAQNIANSGWNYLSSSSFITLSFWIKSSVAQVFSGSLRTSDGTAYSYKFDTPSIPADTWTKVTKIIPGNSNLQFNNDNGEGISLYLYPFLGTTYTSSNANTETWIAAATNTYANNMTSTWWTTNDATFETTGWQFEVGSVATPFEHRSFADELRRCQRYYYRIEGNDNDTAGLGFAVSSNENYFWIELPVPMRDYPTYSGSATAARFFSGNNGQDFNLSSLSISTPTTHANPTKVLLYVTAAGTSVGYGGALSFQADNGIMEFKSEL